MNTAGIVRQLLLVLAVICCRSGLADRPPNILLIVSEDNGPELGCYGDASARTPNLDRLASEGILFRRAFVPQAGCSQSRASLLTGLYPHQHGQIGLATWGFRMYRRETATLPGCLKAVGYRTGIIGKLHINPASAFPFDFKEISSANFQRKNLADYAKFAEQFMSADAAPFFLSVNYPDAHDPWLSQVDGLPERPLQPEDVRIMEYMGVESAGLQRLVADYYNCLSRLDTLIGDLLQVLERTGKADNTIVIYLGDHGADMLRGKRTCYEGGLRVPLLLRWKSQVHPQERSELVATIDLMPTLLRAAGCEPVPGLPGTALQPLFAPGSANWRTHYCAEYHTHAAAPNYFPQRSITDGRFKLIRTLLPDSVHPDYANTIEKIQRDYNEQYAGAALDLRAVIANSQPAVQAAYALMRQPPQDQLYDLQTDPTELHNLAGDLRYAEQLQELQSVLLQWRTDTQDPLLDPEKLRRLTAEVRAVNRKSDAKDWKWKYPDYLTEQE